MTLVEVLMSSVVLAGSSSAALGIWSQAAGEIQRAQRLEGLSLQLETVRIAAHRWLESGLSPSDLLDPTAHDCRFEPAALEAAAAAHLSAEADVHLLWQPDPQGLGHWLELTVPSEDQSEHQSSLLTRRQLFTPAAYGLCRSDEARR